MQVRQGQSGGLLGADRHCQMLATAAGAGAKMWHAYLSENGSAGHPTINARERIGTGPWYNAKGVMIASSVADLHSDNNKISKQTAITEKGDMLPGRGDTPNKHDILTGSHLTARAPGRTRQQPAVTGWLFRCGKARVWPLRSRRQRSPTRQVVELPHDNGRSQMSCFNRQ